MSDLELAFAHYEDMIRRQACGDRSEEAVAKARAKLTAALFQPAQPVAYANPVIMLPDDVGDEGGEWTARIQSHPDTAFSMPLYAAPKAEAASTEGGETVTDIAKRLYSSYPTYRNDKPLDWYSAPKAVRREWIEKAKAAQPLATPSAAAPRQEALTEAKITHIASHMGPRTRDGSIKTTMDRMVFFARAIEAAHGIGGEDGKEGGS